MHNEAPEKEMYLKYQTWKLAEEEQQQQPCWFLDSIQGK